MGGTFYWDNDANPANNNRQTGTGLGTAGTWDTTSAKWWDGVASDGIWNNANNDTAVFWGTAGTVALQAGGITVGGIAFSTTGYTISSNTLTFGAATNNVTFNNVAAATISSAIAGSGDLLVNGGIYGGIVTASTLTLSGAGAGFTGNVTIGNNMGVTLSGTGGTAFSNAASITLNNGSLGLTNTSTGVNRVNNTAAINSNGGTITFTNTSGANVYSEVVGALNLLSGQLNIVEATNQASTGSQTLTFTGFNHTGASNSSTVTFSATTTGPQASGNKNMISITGAGSTVAGQIIGAWATTGTAAANQTDYAIFTSDFVQPANIAATAETTWTTAANAYTLNAGTTLTGTRTLAALRYSGAAATLALGSNNLNTYGLLNGGTGLLTVSGTGALSTPAGGGFLYLNTGNNAITVSSAINDNGGPVAVVKSGSAGILTLGSTASNFSGGLIIEGGAKPTLGTSTTFAVSVGADTNLGATSGGITFNGSATLGLSAGFTINASRTITINNGSIAKFEEGAFSSTIAGKITGTGGLILDATSGDRSWTLSNTANDFQGPLAIGFSSNVVTAVVASLADSATANGVIRLQSTTGSGVFQWSAAATTALVLNNRQIELTGTGAGTGALDSSNASTANTITVNTDLLDSATAAKTLALQGSNTGNNTFAGRISDGATSVVSLLKTGAGTWIVSGNNNSYTGTTTVNQGTLIITGAGATGPINITGTGSLKFSGGGGANSSITVGVNSTLTLDNSAGILADRLNSGNSVTMSGGTLNDISGNGATTDHIGALIINTGGPNAINLTGNASGATSITVNNLTRATGAMLQVTGSSLGAAPGANTTNLIINANGTGAGVVGDTGAAGSTNISINPFILGQDTALTGNAQFGFMTDQINGSMLSNGLRNLTAAEYAFTIVDGSSVLNNVNLNHGVSGLDTSTTINALRLDTGGNVTGAGSLTINSGAVLSVSGAGYKGIAVGTLNFGSTEAVFYTVNSDLNVTSIVTGSGGLSKGGSGVLNLSGANNLTGPIAVTDGVLRLGSSTAISSDGASVVTFSNNSGVYLDLAGNNVSLGALSGGGTSGGHVSLRGATLTLGGGDVSGNYAGIILSSGALVKTGTGTQTLSGANTFSGSTTINNGVLQGGIAAFLPQATTLAVGASGTLDLGGFAVTVGQFGGAGIVTNSGASAALTLGNIAGSFDTIFSGTFNASTPANLTLTKTGGGTLTLNGAAGTATGAWTLNAGTIYLDFASSATTTNIVNGSIASTFAGGSLTVASAATGSISQTLGNVTVNARGGTITMINNGGTSTLTLGTLTATAAGSSLLVNAPSGAIVTFNTDGSSALLGAGRVVFTDGTGSYNWAMNTGVNTATAGLTGYTPFAGSGTSSSSNYLQTDTLIGGVTASESVNTLKISDTTSGGVLALGANTLTITTGGLLYDGANGYMITASGGSLKSNVATTSDLIIQAYGTGVLTIAAPIADGNGASTLTKAGTGKVVLTGTNTYTGGTFINGGILSISSNAQLGNTATSAITISDGATLQTTATFSTGTHTYALGAGNATLDIAPSTTLTIGGVISGAGGLTLNDTGTLILSAASTYTGPTNVNAGVLQGGVASFLGIVSGGTVATALNINSPGSVNLGGFAMTVGSLSGNGNITNSGATATVTVGSNNLSTTYSGVIAGANLTKNGTGVLTLTNNNTYAGTTVLNNGTIRWGADNVVTAGSAVTIGNAAGPVVAVMDLNGHSQTFNATTAITLYGTTSTSSSQAIINIGPGGNLTLANALTETVNATPANGFLGAYILDGTLTLSAARTFTIADSINAAADLTITSTIAGGGGITKAGAGSLVLAGVNSNTGTTTIQAGTITTGVNGAMSGTWTITATGAGIAGTLDINGTTQSLTTLLTLGGSTTTSTPVVNLNGGQLTIGGGITYASTNNPLGGQINGGTLDLGGANRTITVNNSTTAAVDLAISSVIQGSAGLVVAGTGALQLSGANTYTGTTTMSAAGVLQMGATNVMPFGSGKGNLVINAGTLDLNGFATTLNAVTSAASGGLIDNTSATAATLTIGANNTDGTAYAGAIQNSGGGALSLTKTGTGSQVLGGNVTANGTLNITGGALTISGAVSGVTTLNVTNGTLNLDGALITPTAFSTVTVNGGSGLYFRSGAGTALSNITNLNLGSGGGTATVGLEAGTNTSTLTSATAALTANSITLNVKPIAGFAVGNTYNLLAAPSGLGGGSYKILVGGYTFTTSISDSLISVTPTAAVTGNFYWTGGVDNSWSGLSGSNTNWSTNLAGTINAQTIPGAANTVVFSANGLSGNALTTTLDTNVSVNNLVFNNNPISGPLGTITINSGAGVNRLVIAPTNATDGINLQTGAAGAVNINSQVMLGATQTWTVADAASVLNVGGTVSGAGVNLNIAGAGTVILNAASNTFGGAGNSVNVQGGTLQFNNDSQLGNSLNTLTLGTGSTEATLAYTGAATTISRAFTLGANDGNTIGNTISNTGGGALTLSGVISGGPANGSTNSGTASTNAALRIAGGAMVLSGSNTFTGDIIVGPGASLSVGTLANFGSAGGPGGNAANTPKQVFIQNGGTLTTTASLNPQAAATGPNSIFFVFGENSSSNSTLNVNGGTYQLDDAGQFTLNGNLNMNIASGAIVLLGSSAPVGFDVATTAFGNSTLTTGVMAGSSVTVSGQGTLRLSNGAALGGVNKAAITMNTGTILDLLFSGGTTYGNALTVAGDVTVKTGRGTASAANIAQIMGALSIGSSTLTFIPSTNNTAPGVANLTFVGTTTLTGNPTFAMNYVNGTGIGTMNIGALDDGGTPRTITVTTTNANPSALALTGTALSYSGSINVTNGAYLVLGAAGANGTGTVNVTNGSVVYEATNANSGGTVNVGDTSGSAATTLAIGASGVTVNNPFVLLNGSSGATNITTIVAGSSLAAPNTGGFGMAVGGVGFISTGIDLGAKTSGALNIGAAANTSLVITGAVTESGGQQTLNIVGPGNVYLLGDKSFTGGIIDNGAYLGFGPSTTNFSGNLSVNGGGIVLLGSYVLPGTITVGSGGSSLTYLPGSTATDYSSSLTLSAGGTLVVDVVSSGMSVTYGAAFGSSVSAGLTKSGQGTLTMAPTAGSNTWTGATTAGAGTLALNFSSGGTANDIISASSALQLQGGTLAVNGGTGTGALSQTFAGTASQAGLSTITLTKGSATTVTLNTGAITRTGNGVLVFNTIPSGTSVNAIGTSNNAAGIIGGYAILKTSATLADWAIVNGSNVISPYASYTTLTTAGGGTQGSTNYTMGASVTLTAAGGASVTANSLRMSATSTLALGANNSLKISSTTGGIMYALNTGTGTISGTPSTTTGNGYISATGSELLLYINGGTMTISAGIGGTTTGFGLTVSGSGTLNLTNTSTTNTNNFTGALVINGGVTVVGTILQEFGAGTSIVLNGGTLNSNNGTSTTGFTLTQALSLGLNGGTLNYNGTGVNGGWSSGTPITLIGSGSRTLTLSGTDTGRIATLSGGLGDGGGPSSLIVNGGSDTSAFQLSAANAYTGSTTINHGILILNNASALPGESNLVFNDTVAPNDFADLELTATSGATFTRSLGTGPGQVQWLGSGGFSGGTGTNTSAGVTVNIGGTGATLTWGSGGFVPDGSALIFAQGMSNSPSSGAINFLNGIDFGSLTTRTIDVENSAYTFGTSGASSNNTAYDARLSGNLISTVTGGFTKTGPGALWLTGNNAGFLGSITVANGYLIFEDTSALPTNLNSITVSTTTTPIPGVGGIVLQGQTNFNTLLPYLNLSSTGMLALDTSTSENINFQAAGLTSARFGAFGTVVLTGQFTPGTSGVYKLGGTQGNDLANSAGLSVLVLPRTDAISGASSTLDLGSGMVLFGSSNNFGDATHGVTLQAADVLQSGAGGSNVIAMIAKNGGLGSGPISLVNNQAVTATPALGLGAAYGDHTLNNDILLNNTGGITNLPFILGADSASDLVPSAGRMTYTGTLTLQGVSNIEIHGRTTGDIFTGKITGNPSINLVGSAVLFVFNNTTGNPSDFNGTSLFINNADTLVIGHATDLGDSVTSGRVVSWAASNGVLSILPGIGDISTSSNLTMVANTNSVNQIVDVPLGQTFTFTSGVVQSSTRTGQLYTKTGQGTFDIGAIFNPGAAGTFGTAGITIAQGTLRANFTNAATATNIFGLGASSAAAPLTFSGGQLLLIGKAATANSQAFGAFTVSNRANALTLQSAGGTLTTSFSSMGTRGSGATLALSLPTDGPASVAVATGLVAQNSLLVDAASTKTPFIVIGNQTTGAITDWAAVSGTTIVPLSTYSATTTTGVSGNATVATGVDTNLAANATADSLRFNLGEARTINLNGNTLSVGGILNTSGVGVNVSTISNGSLTTASGAAAGADLVIYQANSAGTLTISANIVNNGANAVALTKSGAGELFLSGANAYSGATFLNEGVTTITKVAALGDGSGALNFGGGTLHYTGAGDAGNAGTLSNATVSVARPTTINVDSGANLNLTGTLTGTLLSPNYQVVTKTGQGTLTLGGNTVNTNLPVDVQGGVLFLNKSGGSSNAIGIFASNVLSNVGLTVESGAIAQLGGDTPTGDQILNSSSVQLNGTGMFDLSGHNETIDGLGGSSTSIVTNTSGAASVLTVGSASMVFGAPNHFDGVLQDGTGTLGFSMIGGNTFTLSNTNTYTGKTTIIGQQYGTTGLFFGGISISSVNNLGGNPANFTADQWTFNGGRLVMTGDVTLNASRNNVGIMLAANGGIFEVSLSNTFTVGVPNIISGPGGLTKEGVGTMILQGGANTYTGKTVLNQGVLSISAQGALGNNPTAFTSDQLTFNGGQLSTTATLSLSDSNRGVTIQGYGGTLAAASGTTLTLPNTISGTGDLTLSGPGTVVLGGTNVWTGKTILSGGELRISAAANLGAAPANTVLDQLQLSNNANFHPTASVTLDSTRGVTIGTNGGTITTDASTMVTVPGILSLTNGTLTKAGAGVLVLTNNNNATSGASIAVTNGVLRLGSVGALPSAANLNINGGGVVELAAGDFLLNLGTGDNQVQFTGSGGFGAVGATRTVNLGGAGATVVWNTSSFVPDGSALVLSSATSDDTLAFQNGIDLNGTARTIQVNDGAASVDATLSGALSDSVGGGGLVKTGSGTVSIAAASTYGGTTQVSGGTLQASAPNVFATNSAFILDNNAGVLLDLNNNDQTIASLAGGGTNGGNVNLGNGTLTVAGTATTVYGGQISGGGGLTVAGSSTLSLSRPQLYTGQTNVSGAGRLFVNSTLGSPSIIVGGAATLGGSGSVSGLVTVNSGGTIQAGDLAGIGSLSIPGGLTFLNFGTINVGAIADGINANILNVGTLTTGSFVQAITINVIVNSTNNYQNNTPYTLLTYTGGAIQGAAGFNAFVLGTIAGTNSRTVGFLSDTGSAITLTLNADNPKWTGYNAFTGLISSRWAANNNSVATWKLISAGTATTYLEGDTVLFDDSAFSTTITINDGDVHPSSVTFNNTVAYNLGSPGGTDINGIAGTASFTKNNSGTVAINDANSFTGGVNLNGGVILLANPLGLGTLNGLTFGTNVPAGTMLMINGFNISLYGLDSDVTTPGGATVENGAVGVDATLSLVLQTVGGPLSGNPHSVYSGVLKDGSTGRLNLTLLGDGSLTLTGANTYTGLTTITGPTLQIGNGGTSGSIVGTGGILNNGALIFNRSDSYSYTGNVTGAGTIQITGGGTLTVSGSLGSTGGTTIDAANTLRIGNGGAGGSIAGNISIGAGGALIFNTTNPALAVPGDITGNGSLQVNNASGVIILTGTNSYAGSTTITAGTLQIGGGGTSGSITGDVTDNGTLAFAHSDDISFAGNISGSGGVRVSMASSTATLTLSGNNNYGGGMAIQQGILQLGSSTAVPSGASVTIGGTGTSGTLDLNGQNLTVGSLSTSGTASAQTITNNSATSNSTLTYSSAGTSNFGGLIKNGAARSVALTITSGGKLILSNTNTFTGGTNVVNGTAQLGASNGIGGGSLVLGGTGTSGVLDLGGFNQTVASIAIGPGATSNAQVVGNSSSASNSVLTINGSSTFDGVIQDVLGSGTKTTGLTVASGTTVLTNANTYTGATTINAGATLQLGNGGTSGSLSNATTIADNGTLTYNRSDNVLVGSAISGSGGVQQIGSGTVELTANSSYSGPTVMNNVDGTLKLSGANSSPTGNTTLTNGTLLLNNSGASNGGLAGGTITISGGTIDNVTGSALTLSANNTVTIGGGFTFSGSNDLNFGSGAVNNSVASATIVIGGASRTLALGAMTNTTGTTTNTMIVTGPGNTLVLGSYALSNNATSRVNNIGGTANVTITGPVINGGTSTAGGINFTGSSVLTLQGANNYGGLTTMNNSAGTILFSGSNSGTGGTALTAGTLQLNGASNGGMASGTITITTGTITTLNAPRSLVNNVLFGQTTTASAITFNGSQNLAINGTFTVVSGVARSMTNSMSGGAVLTLAGNVFLSDSATASSTWTIAGAGQTTINGNIANFNGSGINGSITVTNTNTTTLGGANTYSGTTTMNAAAGTLIFSGSNSSSGATSLTTGTLQFNGASNGGIASGTLTLTAGTIQAVNAARSLSNAVTLTAVTASGTQSLNFNGTLTGTGAADRTLTNNIAQPAKLTFNNIAISDNASTRALIIAGTGDNAITGAITNGNATTGSLTLNTTGTTTISAAAGTNTYTGATNAQNGTLVLTASNTLPTGTTLTIGRLAVAGTAATVDMSGIDQTVGGLTVQSDSAAADHLTITSGKTLTVTGNVTIGSSSAATTTTNFIASGGGTLTVNNAAANGFFTVGGYTGTTGGQGNIATADLSSLVAVNISLNTSSGTVRVNNTGTGNTNGIVSTLLLPTTGSATTTITAANLNVGDGGEGNGQAGQVNTMKLGGGVTTFNVGAINIGTGSRDTGAIVFTGASGSLVVRDATGAGRAALNIGTGTATTGVTADANPNNFDVTGHNADLLLGAVAIGTQGRGASLASTLSFDQGIMDMTSLSMSTRTADTTNGAGLARNTTSTVNIGGGTVNIQSGILSMGSAAGAYGTNPAPIMNATVNISGGNVTIGATSGTAISMASYSASGGTGTGAANGTLNLTGGVTTINGNIVKVTPSATNATATVNLAGGTLDMAGNSIGAAGNVVNAIFASGTLQNLAELNGGGALTKTTSGTLVMSGVNTYSGATSINGGVLQFSSLSNNLGTGTAINFDGGTLKYASGNTDDITVRTVTLNAGGGSIDTNGNAVSYANSIAGAGGLTKLGAGTLTYSGTSANTYSGLTTVTAGTLSLNKTAGVNAIAGDGVSTKATADVLVNGGTLIWNASNQLDDNVYLSITSGTANLNGKSETIYHLSNAGGAFLMGGRGSSLTVTDPDWSGGTNDIGAGSFANFGILNISGGVNTVHGNEQYTGPGEGGAVLTVGAGGLNFSGTSSPNLTVNSDFVDGVNVNQGQVVLNGDVSFTNAGSSSTASITNGQARDSDGVTLLGFGTLAGTLDLGGVNRTFNVTNGTGTNTLLVDTQVIDGSVTKTGNGVLKLFNDASHNVANTYAGGTNINGGTVAINSDTSLGSNAGTTTINAGALEVTEDLTSSRNFVLGDVASAISVDTGKTFRNNGVLSSTGSGSLTKTGGGVLVLANNNTYSGTTTVSGGTLQVGVGGTGATGSGALTVVSGATVAGSGTISGTPGVTNHSVQSGGFLAPGDTAGTSIGTLTFNGNLELQTASTTTFQIDSASSHDTITINGSLTLNSGSSISLVDFGNFAATVQGGQSFDLLDWSSIINNGFNAGTNFRSGGTGGGDLNLVDLSSRGLGYDVSQFLSSGVITITPEPGRLMLLTFGWAALMMRRRREVKKG